METFTFEEVRQLLHNHVGSFSDAINSTDNSAFLMGERNMAKTIDHFLKFHGNTKFIGSVPHTTIVGRKDLEK
jgi:hypothetical protein